MNTPSNPSTSLPIHDIPDGNTNFDPADPNYLRLLPEDDGINILGSALGSSAFIESYM
jgi:hypothetical protein